ncbi:response regulator transcription factor [Bdellovibrio sp. HCB288]|uniref:response regulator transcription factor n=1 Tax=Bdellovibrio sp. HCB288 TaxID=3394355 RepID=UPI0039B59FDE
MGNWSVVELVHVLFVDDEPTLLSLFKQEVSRQSPALSFHYHLVANAHDVLKQLDGFGSAPVLVVISKVTTPEMDELALLKVVQRKHPRAKIYICTDVNAPYVRKGNEEHGALRFISKPLNFKSLYGAISEDFLNPLF